MIFLRNSCLWFNGHKRSEISCISKNHSCIIKSLDRDLSLNSNFAENKKNQVHVFCIVIHFVNRTLPSKWWTNIMFFKNPVVFVVYLSNEQTPSPMHIGSLPFPALSVCWLFDLCIESGCPSLNHCTGIVTKKANWLNHYIFTLKNSKIHMCSIFV